MLDNELVMLIKSNPNKGLGILMSEYMGLVCTIVRDKLRTVCDDFEMESCASDIFVEFYNDIDKYSEEKGSVKSFLCVMAKRRAIDLFRKKSKEFGNVSIDNEEAGIEIQDTVNIEEGYIKKEQKKELLEAVNSLGEPDHEIIVRKYYFGESSRQIAGRLSMTVAAVDTRSSRALKKLKNILTSATMA
ncbi:MAG: sigma-70 family RNA polymerase sigma factor [Lachnospiraceae bacterium]|nr:sigma-70 family RNA polymerase sigma factor [Lachnospiraceae bacterium]